MRGGRAASRAASRRLAPLPWRAREWAVGRSVGAAAAAAAGAVTTCQEAQNSMRSVLSRRSIAGVSYLVTMLNAERSTSDTGFSHTFLSMLGPMRRAARARNPFCPELSSWVGGGFARGAALEGGVMGGICDARPAMQRVRGEREHFFQGISGRSS